MGATIAAVAGGFWPMDFVVGDFEVCGGGVDSEGPLGMWLIVHESGVL